MEQLEKELREVKANGAVAAEATTEETQPTYPRVRLNGFADFNYVASNQANTHAAFSVGEFDLFIKAAISEKADFLAETVIAADNTNTWGTDIERILFNYKENPYINIGVGRFHTAIGYYNNAFHHGTWFQTAIGRPSFLEFEDSGGLLPVHTVGVTINGEIPVGNLGLRYVAEVGNGRDYTNFPASGRNPVQNLVDRNGQKAVNMAVTSRPTALPGLQLGTGVYLDHLSPDGLPLTSESIWHNFLLYKNPQWELLAEFYDVQHKPEHGKSTTSTLWFAQIAHQFGPFRPYYRYTHTSVPAGDAAYQLIGGTNSNASSFGIRWDFETYAALKLQYDVTKSDEQKALDQLTMQLALTF